MNAPQRTRLVCRLYAQGLSLAQIARRLECSYNTARLVLVELGIARRPRGAQRLDLAGHVVGRLLVETPALNARYGDTRWQCRCSCGEITVVATNSLRRELTRSCGCLRVETTAAVGRARRGKPRPHRVAA